MGLGRVWGIGLALALGGCDSAPEDDAHWRVGMPLDEAVELQCGAAVDANGTAAITCWGPGVDAGVGTPYLAAVLVPPGPMPPQEDDDVCYWGPLPSMEVFGFSHEIVTPRDALPPVIGPCEDEAEPPQPPQPPGPTVPPVGSYNYFLQQLNIIEPIN